MIGEVRIMMIAASYKNKMATSDTLAPTGVDITQCSVCKTGTLELQATYINIARQGVQLVNVALLHNKGSPQKIQKPVKQMR